MVRFYRLDSISFGRVTRHSEKAAAERAQGDEERETPLFIPNPSSNPSFPFNPELFFHLLQPLTLRRPSAPSFVLYSDFENMPRTIASPHNRHDNSNLSISSLRWASHPPCHPLLRAAMQIGDASQKIVPEFAQMRLATSRIPSTYKKCTAAHKNQRMRPQCQIRRAARRA